MTYLLPIILILVSTYECMLFTVKDKNVNYLITRVLSTYRVSVHGLTIALAEKGTFGQPVSLKKRPSHKKKKKLLKNL